MTTRKHFFLCCFNLPASKSKGFNFDLSFKLSLHILGQKLALSVEFEWDD
jgi:hypothetical protein